MTRPGFPTPQCNMYTWGEPWYLFLREHDIIEIGPEFLEQKGNVLHVVKLTMRSTLSVYDICPLKAKYMK